MPTEKLACPIEGVLIRRPQVHGDARGLERGGEFVDAGIGREPRPHLEAGGGQPGRQLPHDALGPAHGAAALDEQDLYARSFPHSPS